MRDPGGLVGHQAARPAALQEFVAQATLAQSRFADDADDLAVAFARPRQCRLQHLHLVTAADEAREAAAARDVHARVHQAEPLKLVHVYLVVRALDLHLAQIGEREVALECVGGVRR